jgi:hypothetical protein
VISDRSASESNALAVELLDTRGCFELLPQLGAFEDFVFGPDFAITPEVMRIWAESGSWFCAAVTGQAVVGRHQIFSLLSIFVTTTESRDLLLAGRQAEGDLQPWTSTLQTEKPSLYLASIISAASDHLRLMYESIGRELDEFSTTRSTDFHSGFSIASGPAGFSHMSRNGFRAVEGQKYLGHYPMMTIDAESAATEFWQSLLNNGSAEDGSNPAPHKIALFPAVALAS